LFSARVAAVRRRNVYRRVALRLFGQGHKNSARRVIRRNTKERAKQTTNNNNSRNAASVFGPTKVCLFAWPSKIQNLVGRPVQGYLNIKRRRRRFVPQILLDLVKFLAKQKTEFVQLRRRGMGYDRGLFILQINFRPPELSVPTTSRIVTKAIIYHRRRLMYEADRINDGVVGRWGWS